MDFAYNVLAERRMLRKPAHYFVVVDHQGKPFAVPHASLEVAAGYIAIDKVRTDARQFDGKVPELTMPWKSELPTSSRIISAGREYAVRPLNAKEQKNLETAVKEQVATIKPDYERLVKETAATIHGDLK
jgi:hypothetical protein